MTFALSGDYETFPANKLISGDAITRTRAELSDAPSY